MGHPTFSDGPGGNKIGLVWLVHYSVYWELWGFGEETEACGVRGHLHLIGDSRAGGHLNLVGEDIGPHLIGAGFGCFWSLVFL